VNDEEKRTRVDFSHPPPLSHLIFATREAQNHHLVAGDVVVAQRLHAKLHGGFVKVHKGLRQLALLCRTAQHVEPQRQAVVVRLAISAIVADQPLGLAGGHCNAQNLYKWLLRLLYCRSRCCCC
jgi:hypothetical protein